MISDVPAITSQGKLNPNFLFCFVCVNEKSHRVFATRLAFGKWDEMRVRERETKIKIELSFTRSQRYIVEVYVFTSSISQSSSPPSRQPASLTCAILMFCMIPTFFIHNSHAELPSPSHRLDVSTARFFFIFISASLSTRSLAFFSYYWMHVPLLHFICVKTSLMISFRLRNVLVSV